MDSQVREMPDYEWEPINSEKLEFRLLHISTAWSDTVKTRLTTYTRASAPCYRAISYTWAGQNCDQAILCDGKRLLVTENCQRALRAMRTRFRQGLRDGTETYTDYPLFDQQARNYVWIDAICINQNDPAERGAQVAEMAETFRGATETVVYLGTCPLQPTPKGMRMDQKILFQHPWFTRTWMVQEVMSSQRLSVLFDEKDLAWSILEDTKQNQSGLWVHGPGIMMHIEMPEVIRMRPSGTQREAPAQVPARREPRHGTRTEAEYGRDTSVAITRNDITLDERICHRLLPLLERTQYFNCADPRDKLFAIVSLLEKPTPFHLVPDYFKTVEKVYTDLAWFFISLNELSLLRFIRGRGRSEALPSWVVDWEHDSLKHSSVRALEYSTGTDMLGRSRVRPYHAGGEYTWHQRIEAKREDFCLIIRGTLIDPVGAFAPFVDLNNPKDRLLLRRHYHSGPVDVHMSDYVVVFLGVSHPFVLRSRGKDTWMLVGECIVDELMNGQALEGIQGVHDMSDSDCELMEGEAAQNIQRVQDFRIC